MPPLNSNEHESCENCGSQTWPCASQKKRFSAEALAYSSCTNLSAKSRIHMKYHFAKKYPLASVRAVHKSKVSDEEVYSVYLLRYHKRNEHGAQRRSSLQDVYVTQFLENVDVWKKNWKLASTSWWTVRWRMGDIEFLTLHWTLHIFLRKIGYCFWQPPRCS